MQQCHCGAQLGLLAGGAINRLVHACHAAALHYPDPVEPHPTAPYSPVFPCSRALGASEQLHLPPELWVQTLRELLVPVVAGEQTDFAHRRILLGLPCSAECCTMAAGENAAGAAEHGGGKSVQIADSSCLAALWV